MKTYVVSEVPSDIGRSLDGSKLFYCHNRDYPQIPVFGSIGDKAKANKVCRMMNASIGR